MQLKPYYRLILPSLLLGLTGCSSFQDTYNSDTSSMFYEISETEGETSGNKKIDKRLVELDHALDRNAARNALMREFIVESDQACDKKLTDISDQIEDWELNPDKSDKLSKILNETIASRQLDTVTPELAINQPASANNPVKELGESIVSIIQRNRKQTRVILKDREDMDIHRYSVKQALQDMQAYHQSCSIQLGVSEAARLASQRMTTEEKKAEIESLIQLREILMKQGLSTRAIQQKIDAVILLN